MNKPKVTAAELDHIFDEGEEDITQYLDLSKGYHPGWEDKTTGQQDNDALEDEHRRLPESNFSLGRDPLKIYLDYQKKQKKLQRQVKTDRKILWRFGLIELVSVVSLLLLRLKVFEEKVLVLLIILVILFAQAALLFIALRTFIREISKIYFEAAEITFDRVRDQHTNGKEIIKILKREINSRSERESWIRRIEHDYEQYQNRGKLISSFSDLKKAYRQKGKNLKKKNLIIENMSIIHTLII